MKFKLFAVLFCAAVTIACAKKPSKGSDFPKSFQFGVATAAYQIEGAWDADGKGPSIWDVGTHERPEAIDDRTNGDIASDSYNNIDRDVEMLEELGVEFYRLSISWARILPTGDISSLSKAGIRYYNRLINKMLSKGIQPMLTMYHYDLPNELQKIGGLTNPMFPQYFEQYADVLFSNFGDRVKLWTTFNEPLEYCSFGYAQGFYPPFINASGIGDYLCVDNTIKGHALAYRLYRNKYYKKQKGKIGMVVSAGWYYSRKNQKDVVDRALQFQVGWITHPIYSRKGGYPDVMVSEIDKNSKAEGRPWSRLPSMDNNWKRLIQGSADFFGLNYYTSRIIELLPKSFGKGMPPSRDIDSRLNITVDYSWKRAKSTWLYHVPEGLGELLRWIKKEYDNVEVYITEHGWSDDGQLDDEDRVICLKDHLKVISKAIKDGCNVGGYAHWSLMDNFEWLRGYTERFGLYHVNITTPERIRTPKKSVRVYKDIIANRRV